MATIENKIIIIPRDSVINEVYENGTGLFTILRSKISRNPPNVLLNAFYVEKSSELVQPVIIMFQKLSITISVTKSL